MSGADPPSAVADRLREAALVRLVAAGTGDGVAAAGLLAEALDRAGVAYQTSVVALPAPATRETDADLTVALGRPAPAADLQLGVDADPAAAEAFAVVREFGDQPGAVVLALAGVLAAGREPDERLSEQLDRRPGLAIPVAEPGDGLAHSTLVHGPFSGSPEAATRLLEGLSDGRAVASAVALAVAGDEDGVPRGAVAVERLLRPRTGGPVETVGGYADVLDALAREQPGRAVAVVLGAEVDPVPVWRDHAERAHAAVRTAETGRYDGLLVARCEPPAPVGTVARLLRDYRSPEPVVLSVGDGRAAMTATPDAGVDVGAALERAAGEAGGAAGGTPRRGRARFDDQGAFVQATREAV